MDSRELIRHYVLNDGVLLPEEEVQAKIEYSGFLSDLRSHPIGRLSADAVEKLRRGTAMPEDSEIARRALERLGIPPARGIPENNPFG